LTRCHAAEANFQLIHVIAFTSRQRQVPSRRFSIFAPGYGAGVDSKSSGQESARPNLDNRDESKEKAGQPWANPGCSRPVGRFSVTALFPACNEEVHLPTTLAALHGQIAFAKLWPRRRR
jgi:hypothetical protein